MGKKIQGKHIIKNIRHGLLQTLIKLRLIIGLKTVSKSESFRTRIHCNSNQGTLYRTFSDFCQKPRQNTCQNSLVGQTLHGTEMYCRERLP